MDGGDWLSPTTIDQLHAKAMQQINSYDLVYKHRDNNNSNNNNTSNNSTCSTNTQTNNNNTNNNTQNNNHTAITNRENIFKSKIPNKTHPEVIETLKIYVAKH